MKVEIACVEIYSWDEGLSLYWKKAVCPIADEAGVINLPRGAVLKRRRRAAHESEFIALLKKQAAFIDKRNPTNYDNQRVVTIGQDEFWVVCKKKKGGRR